MIGLKNFDVVISGDDVEQGKPHSMPFIAALQKMNIKPSDCIVVENAPLGVEAANNAGIKCIITLNNTPLDISSDFANLILKETKTILNIFLKGFVMWIKRLSYSASKPGKN